VRLSGAQVCHVSFSISYRTLASVIFVVFLLQETCL